MANYETQNYLKETELPHIGEMVRREMERQNLTPTQVGRLLGVKSTTVRAYFKSRSMQAGLILMLGRGLKYDFFSEILEGLPKEYPRKADEGAAQKVADLEARIWELEKEVKIYREVVGIKD